MCHNSDREQWHGSLSFGSAILSLFAEGMIILDMVFSLPK
jgi:hypothetical protein